MPDLIERARNEVLVVDGAMGTMLQRAGIPPEQCPEQLNLTAPDVIVDIHHNYVLAGADCVTTNTFGGTRPKLEEYGLGDQVAEFNRAAVKLARQAGAVHVLGDVGPTGLVMEPLGDIGFDAVFEYFAEQISALAEAGPDAIVIETMTDIAEARCALIAARHVCDLPVLVTLTFAETGRTDLSGTTPEAAAAILEACGASAIGVNCGLGPEQMLPVVEALSAATNLPLVVQANAGIPRLEDGATVFPGTPDEMGAFAARAVELGAAFVGSCCGSTPAFSGAISDLAKPKGLAPARESLSGLALASPQKAVRLGAEHPFAIIGERINPTGKTDLADSLRAGSTSVVRDFAVAQQHAGADLLDVNVGAVDVEEPVMLAAAVSALANLTELPLVIDNTDPVAVEAALKAYPGRALLNSVNGGAASMEGLLPLAARYGAAVLILALDDDGIPHDAEGRLEIAQRVRSAAHAAGLNDADLAVDCLVMTAATDPAAACTTLDAVRRVTGEWGLPTVLGVSNVSHGLPARAELNSAFLGMAIEAGLSAAIANPSDLSVARARAAADVLLGRDENAEAWVAFATAEAAALESGREGAGPAQTGGEPAAEPAGQAEAPASPSTDLQAAIHRGDAERAPALVDVVVGDGLSPSDVIASVLTPAIQELGDAFGRGEVFLPQLIVAAEAMKAAVAQAKTYLPDAADAVAGRVVFGTVAGDVHSIGKDICVSLLESAGFEVTDLGVDVAPERFAEAAAGADAACLSALMTTTLPAMETTARLLADAKVPVIVGGAVVTAAFAERLGAGYADDAPGCVTAVRAATVSEVPSA